MADVRKVSVALTGEQVSALRHAVETGEYATTSEVIREALREQWREGKASGVAKAVDFAATRDEARRRLKKVSRRSA